MCRMLAKVSVIPTGIMHELEQCPNSLLWLSENGRKSHDPDVRGRHNDGCGMAYIDKSGALRKTRHGKDDFWSDDYRKFAMQANSRLYIVHNRFASEGLDISEGGAHPFTIEKFGKELAFCHNGAVDSYMQEARERNTSDSEILLEELVKEIPDISTSSISNSIKIIANTKEYSSLCGFLLSENELYIWRIFNENRKSDYDKLNRYFTLYFLMRKNEVLIASEPLDDDNWQLIPNNYLLSLKPTFENIEMKITALKE